MTAEEFRVLLEAAEMSQKGAVAALGVSLATVCRWLNSETPISADRAQLIRERIEPVKE